MNLSCVLVFLVVINVVLGLHTCRKWRRWPNYDDPTRKIVGGTPIKSVEDFPYIVSLRNMDHHICGASILNKRFVLTAAHCVYDLPISENELSIQYGTVKIDPNGPNIVPVKRVIVHEEFKFSYHDIAILELEEDIKFGKTVSPVILPHQNQVIPNTNEMIVMGWGSLYVRGAVQIHGLYAKISKFDDKYCSKQEPEFNPQFEYCGGASGGGRGECHGDSGGPVIIHGVQFGITSWSHKPCASRGNPGVYTRIPAYRIWIYKNAGV